METIIIAIFIGVIPAIIAQRKGKNFIAWWLYGAALFIIALPHSILIKANKKLIEEKALKEGMKKCPFCAELIKAEASVCRYCGKDVNVSLNDQAKS